jgi:hypothetical protein
VSVFTARFAKGAESAEINDFSIAVERTAMEKCSVHLQRKIKTISLYCLALNSVREHLYLFRGYVFLLYALPALWNAKPIPLGSA